MTNDRVAVEKRLENMKKLYLRINQLINEIPESIPCLPHFPLDQPRIMPQ